MEQDKQFYTYLHCKPNGDIFYVGKGCGNRAYKFTKRNSYHQNIVSKYGKENILVYVFTCESEEIAFADEKQQILWLKKDGYELANFTDGGEGCSGATWKLSEDTKHKMSISKKGTKQSEEHINNNSLSKSGVKHPEWRKLAQSARMKGEQSRAKGKKFSDISRQRMAAAHIGKPHPCKKAICPHCNLEGGIINMKRYHFDNCKYKNDNK